MNQVAIYKSLLLRDESPVVSETGSSIYGYPVRVANTSPHDNSHSIIHHLLFMAANAMRSSAKVFRGSRGYDNNLWGGVQYGVPYLTCLTELCRVLVYLLIFW